MQNKPYYIASPRWDKKYPTHIIVPKNYWCTTPDNVRYVSICKKCNKVKEK